MSAPATVPGFTTRLRTLATEKESWLCIGLDPDPAKMPLHLAADTEGMLRFNRAIIDATAAYAVAFKINFGFYEALGAAGDTLLRETFAAIPEKTLIIADAKRGDIGNTAARYAEAVFGMLNADAVTVNPYMGVDTLEPFLGFPGKGIFVLCLTSNPGARDFQYRDIGGRPLYQVVLETLVEKLPEESFGIVAGATQAAALADLRAAAPHTPFLIPGVGAQGGDLEQAITQGGDKNGNLALINASRSIIYASNGQDFAEAAAREARSLRDAINKIRRTLSESHQP